MLTGPSGLLSPAGEESIIPNHLDREEYIKMSKGTDTKKDTKKKPTKTLKEKKAEKKAKKESTSS